MRVHFASSFAKIPTEIRQALSAKCSNPFFNSYFLRALEGQGCAVSGNGWTAHHLWLSDKGRGVFFMPLYLKKHSWGEFVFDQVWAQAYQRYGVPYYPKLVSAIPYTPSLGPRWWCHPDYLENELISVAIHAVADAMQKGIGSSWHLLFAQSKPNYNGPELLARKDVQFHWCNQAYGSFTEFLDQLKSRKRKALKKERLQVHAQGVRVVRKLGSEISEAEWMAFYQCYENTYFERGMSPYLSLAFFLQIAQSLSDQLMMVQAYRQQKMIAGALFFFDKETLYGRHWGSIETVSCLHFEACFYQGIEFCIERGLQRFDPGTQGEHKLLRGFEPVPTVSWHLIGHNGFENAIADFLRAETQQMDRYESLARQHLPYRSVSPD